MTVACQAVPAAIWAQVPSRSPFSRGRPRLPVRGGFGPCSTALAGSRVVQVAPSMARGCPWKAASPVPCTCRPGNFPASSSIISAASSTWEAVPLPRHSRNSTGSATGEEQNASLTTIAATTQAFPNAIFLPPCADPSEAHRACATFRPHLRKNVPSTATMTGSLPASRHLTISRATARPSSSISHTACEKNQHARRHRPAIPAAAAIPTTVDRSARIIPHASTTNNRCVERRVNTGASSSSRSRQVAGTGTLAGGSIGGHSGHRWCDKHRRCCPIPRSPATSHVTAVSPQQSLPAVTPPSRSPHHETRKHETADNKEKNGEAAMSLDHSVMTDERRKPVALEYLSAFDHGG